VTSDAELVEVCGADFRVGLSTDECWQLYVWLGTDAPFVRNQLSVIRRGGRPGVSLATAEERRQVLNALANDGRDPNELSDGLRLLHTALGEGPAGVLEVRRES
jgi:hypothetical protein